MNDTLTVPESAYELGSLGNHRGFTETVFRSGDNYYCLFRDAKTQRVTMLTVDEARDLLEYVLDDEELEDALS